MLKRRKPGIDSRIAPAQGVTRDGQPMGYSRAPAPDLSPWLSGLYATIVDVPDGQRLTCGLLNDNSFIRIQLEGEWTAKGRDGEMSLGRAALFFGPQTRLMPVSVTGRFVSLGISLRPGIGHALKRFSTVDYLDRLGPVEELGLPGAMTMEMLEQGSTPEEWLGMLEAICRQFIAEAGGREPDPVTARFEELAFTDPAAEVREFARDIGVDVRRLERIVGRDFGLPPKQVLRRARALDMASHLRGVADGAEASELELRYYDQSHMIRDFVEYFGMTPRQFVETPQPILTLALETRQARRLEAIRRLTPGAPKPWEAGPSPVSRTES
ncbi:MAG: helix-turn-helix domain-containing protein [Novosphingobium sp.]